MNEYGLLIGRHNRFGTEYIEATLVCRESDKNYPRGCNTDGEGAYDLNAPKHLHGLLLDGLRYGGFVSDNDGTFISYKPEYRDVHSLDIAKAERAIRTLKKVLKRIEADQASEVGDVICSIYKALKLSFIVERVGQSRGSSYGDNEWHFMMMAEGRNRFRQLIAEAVAEHAAKTVAA